MALDPDSEQHQPEDAVLVHADHLHEGVDGGDANFQAVEPDMTEVQNLGDGFFVAEHREFKCDGRAPPTGWRRDDFGKVVIRRTARAPPWSLRPPHLEPQPWLSLHKRHKDAAGEEWRLKDPAGFAAQERRRAEYLSKVAVTIRIECMGFLVGVDEVLSTPRTMRDSTPR